MKQKIYADNSVLYIAGTSSIDDVITDLFIPMQQIRQTERYQYAYDYIKKNENKESQIIEVVGHSLGSAIGEALSQDFPNIYFRLYGSPSIQGNQSKRVMYYRHPYDPVSITNIMPNLTEMPLLEGINPHAYDQYAPGPAEKLDESDVVPFVPPKRGRPKGSKNKPKSKMD